MSAITSNSAASRAAAHREYRVLLGLTYPAFVAGVALRRLGLLPADGGEVLIEGQRLLHRRRAPPRLRRDPLCLHGLNPPRPAARRHPALRGRGTRPRT